jgi:RNA polymerase sigma-70 factor (ECF subfamily)
MGPTSLTLLDRLQQNGRHEDWTRFVELYRPFIRRFIKLDAKLADDAEDICQEVMKKIVAHLPRFRRERDGSFRTWLKTITVNEVNYYWRRRLRGGSAVGAEQHVLEGLIDPNDALSRQWDQEHGDHVLRSLQELISPEFSPTTWRAFQLRVFEERSTDEVAALLKISKNAVDIAKSRVLARLRKEAAAFLD